MLRISVMGFDSNDPRMKDFFRGLVHEAIRGLMYRSIWGLPMGVSVVLLILLIGAVVWFGIY